MSFTIPVWLVVMVVFFAPFVTGWATSLFHEGGDYNFDLLTPFVFCVSAAACWVGLLVWWAGR